jgi:hypothetical protein
MENRRKSPEIGLTMLLLAELRFSVAAKTSCNEVQSESQLRSIIENGHDAPIRTDTRDSILKSIRSLPQISSTAMTSYSSSGLAQSAGEQPTPGPTLTPIRGARENEPYYHRAASHDFAQ